MPNGQGQNKNGRAGPQQGNYGYNAYGPYGQQPPYRGQQPPYGGGQQYYGAYPPPPPGPGVYPGYPPYPPAPPTPEQELAMLQEQADYLEQVLSDIKERIEEIGNMQE